MELVRRKSTLLPSKFESIHAQQQPILFIQHYYSVEQKGLSRVVRIEHESSVYGQLAVYGQAEQLATQYQEISKMNRPFLSNAEKYVRTAPWQSSFL